MLLRFKQDFKNKNEVYLRIKVSPNSAKTEVKGVLADETVKINIAAPPTRGKANQELISYLAREFEILKNNVTIISGVKEKLKLIKIVK